MVKLTTTEPLEWIDDDGTEYVVILKKKGQDVIDIKADLTIFAEKYSLIIKKEYFEKEIAGYMVAFAENIYKKLPYVPTINELDSFIVDYLIHKKVPLKYVHRLARDIRMEVDKTLYEFVGSALPKQKNENQDFSSQTTETASEEVIGGISDGNRSKQTLHKQRYKVPRIIEKPTKRISAFFNHPEHPKENITTGVYIDFIKHHNLSKRGVITEAVAITDIALAEELGKISASGAPDVANKQQYSEVIKK